MTGFIKLAVAASVLTGALTWAGGEENLRNPKTKCGYFLTHVPNPAQQLDDTKGERLTLSLDPRELERWIESQPPETFGADLARPEKKIVAVGASFERAERRRLEAETREALKARGYGNVPVETIRHYNSWAAEARGVFQANAEGEWVKVSDVDGMSIREALRSRAIVDGVPTLIVGAPQIGKTGQHFRDSLSLALERYGYDHDAEGPTLPIREQSVAGALVGRALKHPIQAIRHLWDRAWSWTIFKEDYQAPTQAEARNAMQKLLVPGLLTATVLGLKGLAEGVGIEVALPIMLAAPAANGFNSYLTGYFRSTLQNWVRRSRAIFPDQYMKDLTLSALFTPIIYFGGDPSHWSGFVSLAAWQTFLATKTLSMLFNAGWRAPNNAVIASWERYAVDQLGLSPTDARNRGSAIGKYTSYVMTQFYILSIFSKDALFKVGYGSEGFDIFGNVDLPSDTTQLMAFNFGHAFMFGVGTLSAALTPFRSVQTRFAEWAFKLDERETRLVHTIFRSR